MSEPPDRPKVIEKYLQGLGHDDGYSHGYLKSDEELKLFERSLATVIERYAVRTSRDLSKSSKSNVVFSMIHCGSRISLDNLPFRVVKETVKVCIFGTEYYKKTQEKKKNSSHQNHGFEDMEAFSQNMDKSVAERIQMLAREGITSVSDVKKCLHYYVHDVLFANKEKPDSSCRAFFPTHHDISNQIQAVLKKDRFSTVDEENARILIEKIRGERPESSVVYRPYAARSFVGSSDSDNVKEGVASECEDTLLFCLRTKFMRSMLKKYGGSVVCLGATHKTSEYALPLFLLVVKTPSGYTPAGVFIIQFETTHCIAEALDVFKQWCDNWSPQYWMVDYSKAEISAIKQVFPESQISICDFHRLLAWQRWLRRKENNISDPDEDLRLMKHVARASNQHDFDKAVEVLVDSEYWKNERFRSYFEEVWLSVKELWVMSYRLEFDVVLTTNNGIEAQNRVLKAQYVKSSSGKRSLASLIMTVVHGYLPDKEAKFHEAARRQSSAYRQYSENVPAYLHNRPHGFVKHMQRRLVNAEEYTPTDMEELPVEGVFTVAVMDVQPHEATSDSGSTAATTSRKRGNTSSKSDDTELYSASCDESSDDGF
ncbi:hypothetical protein HPB51_021651 [Rhipicephalus microplus]|uniref:ZSWIM1/3 RNaseH-like domain-containing protein n=1 Tax=Rhipicephalus microplus TaxID=6941 RepID=A0A9J6EUQ9_RHIMP|nr:hypothetical protein HPB51_021651 [Rhipicephalus microplus]